MRTFSVVKSRSGSLKSPILFCSQPGFLRGLSFTALLFAVAVSCSLSHAKEVLSPSARIEKFFKTQQFGTAVLSPNQQYLAVTTSIKGRLHLAVVDLQTKNITPLSGFDDADVWSVHWISNDRLVFDVIDRDSRDSMATGNGFYSIGRDGSKGIELAKPLRAQENWQKINNMSASPTFTWEFKFLDYIDTFDDGSNNVLVKETIAGNLNETNLYRMNMETGRKLVIVNSTGGDPKNFIVDNKHELRVVVAHKSDDKTNVIWYRDNPTAAWKSIDESTTLEPGFHVLGFDSDNKTMYVSARNGKDKFGIYKFDFATNKIGEEVLTDPDVDVAGGLVFEYGTNRLLGIRVHGEPPRTHWLDKDFAAVQKVIDAAYPGYVNVLSGDPKSRILVFSYSATDPGAYSLYDPSKKKMEPLFKKAKWISPQKMSETLVFDYAARDGYSIPSYLTLPNSKPTKALPLVVLVHGGPSTRDTWDFDPEVQFLAELGYAVLQPQFRGSWGFGENHFKSGLKQWGLRMQDDITDGVRNLISQGVVDSKRVCIMGTSYGGYAALMGAVKEPEMFRCAIDLLGVSNISLLYKHGRWYDTNYFKYSSRTLIGDPEKDRERFDATSPDLHADKILAPVFMVYNDQDNRVPMIHGERMRDALKAKEKTFEWMKFSDEEHGFAKEENRYKLYDAIEKFLNKYNPADQ